MQTQISNKLRAYSLVAGSLSLSGSLSAQIIYTDVNPDVVLTYTGNPGTSSFDVDFDGDGTQEVILNNSGYGVTDFFIYSSLMLDRAVRSEFYLTSNYSPYAVALNFGDSIKANDSNWVDNNTYFNQFISTQNYTTLAIYSYWAGQNDKYLGVRFETISGQTHYGWIRMSLNAKADSLVIKDFAYNNTPNQLILAGDFSTSINAPLESNNPEINIFENILFVNLAEQTAQEGSIEVINSIGQRVYQGVITNPSMQIPLESLPKGIYIVQINMQTRSLTRKVYIH